MMEWRLIESRLLARQLKRAPVEMQAKYAVSRSRVQHLGPHLPGGYRVHALRGQRKGQKSARLDRQWRIIFKVFQAELVVEALEVTPHQY